VLVSLQQALNADRGESGVSRKAAGEDNAARRSLRGKTRVRTRVVFEQELDQRGAAVTVGAPGVVAAPP